MKIASHQISESAPCFIIAEAGLNHNGLLRIAKLLVDVAVLAGAQAVKFQKRDLKSLYRAEELDNRAGSEQQFQYILPQLEEYELPKPDFRELRAYCDEKGIIFLCSPWDIPSADFVGSLGVPAFKVASADMTNFILLEHLCSKGRPLVVSTGMSTESEVAKTVEFLKSKKADFALLHCNSTYPAAYDELNLRCIPAMKEQFGVPVGYSGHERGGAAALAAVALGARIVEKHLTLDRTMKGPDHPASLEPEEFINLVKDIRVVERSLGSPHRWVTRGEFMNREVLGKSLVAAHDIRKGRKITREMMTAKSPGKGISPQRLGELLGTVARRDIPADGYFVESDFGKPPQEIGPVDFPLPWGLIVRFSDIDKLVPFGPQIVEVHLTEADLSRHTLKSRYEQKLAVHMAEYIGENLVDLCSRDRELRARSIRRIEEVIGLALSIAPYFETGEPPKIVIHPGGMSFEPEPNRAAVLLDNLADSLGRINTEGVELLLENMPPLPWYFGGQWYHNVFVDAEEIAGLCRQLNLKLCLDVSHAQLACNFLGCDLMDYVRRLKPFTRHVHMADAAGKSGEGLQIGEGEIDFEQLLSHLDGVDGYFLPEIWQGHKFGAEGFALALKRLAGIASRISSRNEPAKK